ncbi:MAG: DUF2142 domain-containing protein [Armatimonadota bacterium]
MYIVLSVASALVTRLRCGPDEPAHFIYVREIGEHFRLPELSHVETHEISLHSSHEAHQPPLYYALAAVPYFVSRSFGAGIDTSWLAVRLFTVLIGAGWVYFLYRLSREFFPKNRYFAVLGAACVGLMPLSTYIGGVINNDALISLFFTAALWLIVKSIRRGCINRKAALQIGIVSGLAILSKSQGLFLLPLIVIAAFIIMRRKGWGTTAGNAAIAVLIAGLVSSVWFVRNRYVCGSFITQSLHNPMDLSSGNLALPEWIFIIQLVTRQLFDYFWTPFWLISEFIDVILYQRLLMVFCVFVLIGVLVHLRSCRCSRSTGLDCREDVLAFMALPGILIYMFLFRHTIWVDRGAFQQGRLLLPAAGILSVGVVIALNMLIIKPVSRVIMRITSRTKPVRYEAVQARISAALGILLVIGLLAANLGVLHGIAAYYRIH